MKESYRFIKKYQGNKELRDSFNELIGKTFCLNFEQWYQEGYWDEHYQQYSIVDGERVVSSISVMEMEYSHNGIIRHYIQLGGVATYEEYRHQGLSRYLMEHIIADYQDQVDGIFLMGNDSVLEFYPRFGFQEKTEYCYSKKVNNSGAMTAKKLPMEMAAEQKQFAAIVQNSACNGAFEMIHNANLVVFYLKAFMKDWVYYIEAQDAYVIAEIEEDVLKPYGVYSTRPVDMNQILKAFGSQIHTVEYQFTPLDTTDCDCKVRKEEDCTLFMLGKEFDQFEDWKVGFPVISHT